MKRGRHSERTPAEQAQLAFWTWIFCAMFALPAIWLLVRFV